MRSPLLFCKRTCFSAARPDREREKERKSISITVVVKTTDREEIGRQRNIDRDEELSLLRTKRNIGSTATMAPSGIAMAPPRWGRPPRVPTRAVARGVLVALVLMATSTPGCTCCSLPIGPCRTDEAPATDEQRVHDAIATVLAQPPWPQGTVTPMKVSVRTVLNQIIDVDERQQVLTTGVFLEQRWHHPQLGWIQMNMTSVKAIRMSEKKIWTPDTYIYNSANDAMSGFLTGMYVLINANGDVQWPIRTQLKTFCPMDITMFPFDLQSCTIHLGSWVHSGKQRIVYVHVVANASSAQSVDLSSYTDNSDWVLVSATIKEENYAIKLILELKRRSVFYIWILIIPFIMLTILSLMTFHMPSTSNEKLSLSLSVFMAYSMFMIMISERIPPATKHVPLIGIYLATIMTMTASSILVTVLIINIFQHKGFQRPSHKVRDIFITNLASFLKVDYPEGFSAKDELEDISRSTNKSRSSFMSRSRHFVPILNEVLHIVDNIATKRRSSSHKQSTRLYERKVGSDSDLNRETTEYLGCASQDIQQTLYSCSVDNNKKEWKLIAVVLDKLFFYIFIVIYFFIYFAIFLTPFIFKSSNYNN